MLSRRRRIAVSLSVSLAVAPSFAFAGPVTFVPYRAAYDLVADTAKERLVGPPVKGRLVMEFTGSRCEGYTSKVRFVTEQRDAEGARLVTDIRSTTFETTDGHFEFDNEVHANESMVEESSGSVTRGPGGVTLRLIKPAGKTVTLERGVVFPTEQLVRIIEAADEGENFVPLMLYNGTEASDTVFETATVIGRSSTAADDFGRDLPIGKAGFAGLRHWPLTMSYFENESREDSAPAYVMSFVLYENGVGRDLKIDYGDFALLGTLVHLEMLPVPPCP